MNKARKMNESILKAILRTIPNETFVFTDKLQLTLSNNAIGDFDRMVLECDEDGRCTVWFDEMDENGIANTYSLGDFADKEIEKVLNKVFDDNIVDATCKYLTFCEDNKKTLPKFAICDVRFNDEPDSEGEFNIKLSCDVVSDEEDNQIGYYCGNGFNELLSLFKEDNNLDFVVLDVKEFTSEI